jgi:hypothetical protein
VTCWPSIGRLALFSLIDLFLTTVLFWVFFRPPDLGVLAVIALRHCLAYVDFCRIEA